MLRIGLDVSKSALVNNLRDGLDFASKLGFPVLIRPSFTLGGTGGGIAYNREELMEILARGLDLSPVHECLIEESVLGWKEFELEVMRDLADNVIIICSIENFDPMGVHTGDSITVAPAQTLTDREYQKMRDAAIAVMREIGVETGGSNVQFAINPVDGRMTVIEMNPRVSRSSALASKATGFPIAKIAAKLAVGYTLDEIPNDITRKTPACFEPTIDYVVVKIPKWQFEKFPGADENMGPRSILRRQGVEDLLARAGRIRLGAGDVPCLSAEDSLLVLCLHAAKHLWTRLIWIADIAESLRAPDIDFALVVRRARALGIARIVGVSCWLAERLLGAAIPAPAREVIEHDPEVPKLGEEYAARLARASTYNFDSTEYFRQVWRLRERPSDRCRYLWRLASTPGPGEIAAIELPESLFPLYRVVRIGRLLRRLV